MMKMKTALYSICAVLALLLGAACTPQEQPGGAVTLLLSSGLPETRAVDPCADGQQIKFNGDDPDLLLLMFGSNGNLVAKYPDSGHSEVLSSPTPSGSDMMIRISETTGGGSIPEGTYSIYALANTAGLWSITDGTNTININDITTKAKADLLYFTPLFADDSPSKPHPELQNDLLPLSAIGTVSVNANGNGSAEVQMKRCAAQVVVKFVNNYSEELTLQNFAVTFHGLNTSTGYLFPHTPDIPAGIVYANLFHEEASVTLEDNTDPQNEVYELSGLVFPGAAPGGSYTCDIAFDIQKVGDSTLNPVSSFSYTDLPVHNKRGENITSLSRNQKLSITITINQGEMLSFSFDVGDWTEKTELVSFD